LKQKHFAHTINNHSVALHITWQFAQLIMRQIKMRQSERQAGRTVRDESLPYAAMLQRLQALQIDVTRERIQGYI
jgi:hypothetical protein